MSYRRFQIYFFIAIIALSAVLTLMVFRPYLTMLAFGGIIAIVTRPFYMSLLRWAKSETAAAFLTVLGIAILVLIPSALFFALLSGELVGLFGDLRDYFGDNSITQILQRWLPVAVHDQIPTLMDESLRLVHAAADAMSKNLLDFFSNVVGMFFGFAVVLICAYYLLKDGHKVKKELLALSPLGDQHDEHVFQKIVLTIRTVMAGFLVVGLVKGVLAGIFYWVFGVPAPLFWGTMTGFASFIPVLGSSLVSVPAIGYLYLTGHYGAGTGLLVVSVILIGTVDNLIQPKLVESRTKIHPLLVLLSILGGLQFYGFAGFILGPLTLSVTMALVDIYKKEFRQVVEVGS